MMMALVVLLAVALLAFLLRRSSDEVVASPPTGSPDDEPIVEAFDDDEDEASAETIAITSDGWVFVPDGHGIHLIPHAVPDEPWRAGAETAGESDVLGGAPARRNFREGRPGERIGRGDLIAARVKRGAPGVDPWRLEGLGRDREYRHWSFETEDAARAALELIEARVVPVPREIDPDETPIGDADFVLARAEADAIEAELAAMPDEDETRAP